MNMDATHIGFYKAPKGYLENKIGSPTFWLGVIFCCEFHKKQKMDEMIDRECLTPTAFLYKYGRWP